MRTSINTTKYYIVYEGVFFCIRKIIFSRIRCFSFVIILLIAKTVCFHAQLLFSSDFLNTYFGAVKKIRLSTLLSNELGCYFIKLINISAETLSVFIISFLRVCTTNWHYGMMFAGNSSSRFYID